MGQGDSRPGSPNRTWAKNSVDGKSVRSISAPNIKSSRYEHNTEVNTGENARRNIQNNLAAGNSAKLDGRGENCPLEGRIAEHASNVPDPSLCAYSTEELRLKSTLRGENVSNFTGSKKFCNSESSSNNVAGDTSNRLKSIRVAPVTRVTSNMEALPTSANACLINKAEKVPKCSGSSVQNVSNPTGAVPRKNLSSNIETKNAKSGSLERGIKLISDSSSIAENRSDPYYPHTQPRISRKFSENAMKPASNTAASVQELEGPKVPEKGDKIAEKGVQADLPKIPAFRKGEPNILVLKEPLCQPTKKTDSEPPENKVIGLKKEGLPISLGRVKEALEKAQKKEKINADPFAVQEATAKMKEKGSTSQGGIAHGGIKQGSNYLDEEKNIKNAGNEDVSDTSETALKLSMNKNEKKADPKEEPKPKPPLKAQKPGVGPKMVLKPKPRKPGVSLKEEPKPMKPSKDQNTGESNNTQEFLSTGAENLKYNSPAYRNQREIMGNQPAPCSSGVARNPINLAQSYPNYRENVFAGNPLFSTPPTPCFGPQNQNFQNPAWLHGSDPNYQWPNWGNQYGPDYSVNLPHGWNYNKVVYPPGHNPYEWNRENTPGLSQVQNANQDNIPGRRSRFDDQNHPRFRSQSVQQNKKDHTRFLSPCSERGGRSPPRPAIELYFDSARQSWDVRNIEATASPAKNVGAGSNPILHPDSPYELYFDINRQRWDVKYKRGGQQQSRKGKQSDEVQATSSRPTRNSHESEREEFNRGGNEDKKGSHKPTGAKPKNTHLSRGRSECFSEESEEEFHQERQDEQRGKDKKVEDSGQARGSGGSQTRRGARGHGRGRGSGRGHYLASEGQNPDDEHGRGQRGTFGHRGRGQWAQKSPEMLESTPHPNRGPGRGRGRWQNKKTNSDRSPITNQTCSICDDPIGPNQFITLDCGHRMHFKCAWQIAQKTDNPFCPVCQKTFNTEHE